MFSILLKIAGLSFLFALISCGNKMSITTENTPKKFLKASCKNGLLNKAGCEDNTETSSSEETSGESDEQLRWTSTIGNLGSAWGVALSGVQANAQAPEAISYAFDTANMTCDNGSWAPNIAIHSTTGTITGTPSESDIGICTVKVVATSGADTINETFTISIYPILTQDFAASSLNLWRGGLDMSAVSSISDAKSLLQVTTKDYMFAKSLAPDAATSSLVYSGEGWNLLFKNRSFSWRSRPSQSTVGNKIFVFGGFTQLGIVNDVWAYDMLTGMWNQIKPRNPSGTVEVDYPGGRYGASQSTIDSKIIIFGGYDSGWWLRNDVWAFDTINNSWSKLKEHNPAGTEGVDYPAVRISSQSTVGTKIIIFGGDGTSDYNDVWAFETTNNTWTKLKDNDPGGVVDVNYPKRRKGHSQSSVDTKIIIFGGYDGTDRRNDVWAFDTADNSWTKLKADDPGGVEDVNYPKKRNEHSQSTIATKIVIFGGSPSSTEDRNDVWAFETADNTWSKLKANNPAGTESVDYPSVRAAHSQSSWGSKIISYGGNDLWSFDTTDNTWTKLKNEDAAGVEGINYPLWRGGQSQSSVDTKAIIFGGTDQENIISGGTTTYFNDVWAFDIHSDVWQSLKSNNPAGTVDVDYPKGRAFQSQSTIGTKLIVFGGLESTTTKRNDVWAFETSNNTWTKLKADDPGGTLDTDYPMRRDCHNQSIVGTSFIMFGGSDATGTERNDVWSFETSNNTWTKLKADDPGGTVDVNYPKRRRCHSQSTVGTKIIIVGGDDGSGYRNDVWAFDTADNSWTKLKNDNPGGTAGVDYPRARSHHTQSTIGTKVIVFGGTRGLSELSDLWAFETTNNTWTRLKSNNPGGKKDINYPLPRYSTSQSTIGSKIVIIGGIHVDSYLIPTHDVWTFDTTPWSTGQHSAALLSFDLSARDVPVDLQINLNLYGEGDAGGGTLGKGAELWVWNEGNQEFTQLGSNTATSLALGSMQYSVPKTYIAADDKVYFLMLSGKPYTASRASNLDLNSDTLRLTIPYQP